MTRRKLLALLGAVMLLVTMVTPGIARQAKPAAPAAAPERVASAPASPVDESKVPHYFGPFPNWANSQFTLADAPVTISAAAVPVTPVTVGNPLIARQYASDDTFSSTGSGLPGQGVVLVVIPTPLPAGTLQTFQSYVQTTPALGSPGNTFNAYVLHPTGNANEYSIVTDFGSQLVPTIADGVTTYDVTDTAVAAGDVIAFYGQGIPLDLTGTDLVAYPAPAAPPAAGTFVLGGAGFPLIASRTYSFAATVMPPSGAATGSGATAVATVGANGAVTGITITDPGSGYTSASVSIAAAWAPAQQPAPLSRRRAPWPRST